jgi:plastocyanin
MMPHRTSSTRTPQMSRTVASVMVVRVTVVSVAVALAALFGGILAGCGDDAAQPGTEAVSNSDVATFEFVIPVGAGEALDAGTPLEILPAELQVDVGDTIRIENQDDRGHTVGPFFVGANETLTQRFSTPGEFEGVCTVHPSGQLVLVVNA